MSDETDAVPDTGGDLEYDLAHESTGADSPVAERDSEPQHVPTATPDYAGDYSYDLAHDIPKS